MNAIEITNELNQIGETGTAKVVGTDLWVKQEENSRWLLAGQVEDAQEAKQLINEHFAS